MPRWWFRKHGPRGGPAQPQGGAGRIGLTRNPISLLGALLALLGLAAMSFALGVQVFGVRPSPYFGILIYLLLPMVLVTGLLLVPAGMAWEARRRARAARRGEGMPPAFRIDLADPRHVQGVLLFGVATAIILGVLGAAGYRAVEFTDSVTFCGQTCHQVMAPQYEPYQRSAHARVPCSTCHIGEGASWWVQSKLSGLGQVFATALDTYPRPIPAPIEDLRPARETCEQCHWRERAYGLRLKVFRQYAADEGNTEQTRPLAFRVGTGGSEPGGVHWHTAARIWYRSVDQERQKMGWVRVEEPDGTTTEWTNPAIPIDQLRQPRLMDCVDCHNRTGHQILSPEQLVDEALASGALDRTLPYLKREALRLLFAADLDPDSGELAATWREGWFDRLWDFYRQNYPDVALQRASAIRQAVRELERISGQVNFPDMKTNWRTYINNNGHTSPQRQEDGCFRCHTALVSKQTAQMLPSPDCAYCHYELPPGQIED